jgi:hypothetical protein
MLIPSEEIDDVNKLKKAHPEIQHWSDDAVREAYGHYCQSALQAGWTSVEEDGDTLFLIFLWLKSVNAVYEDGPVLYDLLLEIQAGTPWKSQTLTEKWIDDGC